MDFHGTLFQYILIALTVASFAIQIFIYLKYYLRSAWWKSSNSEEVHTQPVSVVICARNEASNLREYLPSILNQKHPDFEVVVVNDTSEDDSDMVLSMLKTEYPHLKTSNIAPDQRFHHNKKLAQVIGIKAAKNDLLLLTDAGCRPESDRWLEQMTAPLASGMEITLGYGGYFRSVGLLNSYVRFDAMFNAMQFTGMALRGSPYKGVGRNLAYRKDLFLKENRFASHYHIASGDDNLFVYANATAMNTAVELSISAHTRSLPAKSITEFVRQKRGYLATTHLYRVADRLRLFMEPLSRVIFYASSCFLLFMLYLWPVVAGTLFTLLLLKIVVFRMAAKTFNEKGLLLPSLLFDIISPIINTLLYFTKFGNKAGNKAWR
jgi:glycosyltransferase involved in cell wall biosynthesis